MEIVPYIDRKVKILESQGHFVIRVYAISYNILDYYCCTRTPGKTITVPVMEGGSNMKQRRKYVIQSIKNCINVDNDIYKYLDKSFKYFIDDIELRLVTSHKHNNKKEFCVITYDKSNKTTIQQIYMNKNKINEYEWETSKSFSKKSLTAQKTEIYIPGREYCYLSYPYLKFSS